MWRRDGLHLSSQTEYLSTTYTQLSTADLFAAIEAHLTLIEAEETYFTSLLDTVDFYAHKYVFRGSSVPSSCTRHAEPTHLPFGPPNRNHLGHELRERMVNFIEYKFEREMGCDEADILDELSDSLRIAALKEMHLKNLKKISWLVFDDDSFMHELLQLLLPETFGPGDKIFLKGEVGTTLYFVVSGKCRLSGIPGGGSKVLGEGSFFGEMSVLFDERRSATIEAMTFVNVFELTQWVSSRKR